MIEKLVKAGANPNAPLTREGDTALMMASRNGKPDAIKSAPGQRRGDQCKETWGGTTALDVGCFRRSFRRGQNAG